jgi:hypothetical protein
MKCSKIQKKLSDYLDNALPDNEKDAIANHLLTCATCQKEFSIFEKLRSTLGQLDGMPVPCGFSSNLIGRIHETERKKEIVVPYRIFGRTIKAATCAVMILLSILFGYHIGRTLYKETAGKKLHHDSRVIEILKTQAGIELAGYLKKDFNSGVYVGGGE